MSNEEIKIPAMGESVTEATIGTFLKPNGASVNEGEEVVELETEKVNQVLYAPAAGTLTWQVKEQERVKIGQVIGVVDTQGEKPKPMPEEKKAPEKQPERKETSTPPAGKNGKRIMKEEFIQELKAPTPASDYPTSKPPEPEPTVQGEGKRGEGKRRKMTQIRRTIAKRLVDALHSAAMLTTFNEVDMSAIMELRSKHQENFSKKQGVKLGFMSFFVKAVVEGLKAFPDFNSFIDQDEVVTHSTCNIGIAVGTERGLVVPVVRECEKKSFGEIEKSIAQFAEKARGRKLSIADLEGGGFTITNGGIYGSMLSTPILNPPQTGILGMHKIMKRPVVVDDAIVIRPMMYLALSYDHRLVDGKEAVSFLVRVKEILEDPTKLIFFDEI